MSPSVKAVEKRWRVASFGQQVFDKANGNASGLCIYKMLLPVDGIVTGFEHPRVVAASIFDSAKASIIDLKRVPVSSGLYERGGREAGRIAGSIINVARPVAVSIMKH